MRTIHVANDDAACSKPVELGEIQTLVLVAQLRAAVPLP
jgi:hypothetical protein